jgi:fatty-acyl-CoA synthase
MAGGISVAATHSELIVRALRCFPERVAFRQGDRTVHYAEAEWLLSRFVTVLHELGLRPGEGIGLLSPNRPEVWVAEAAPGFLGCSYTALHPIGSFEDHLFACDEAELKVLIVDPAYAERGAALLEHASSVEHLLTFGPSSEGRDILRLADSAAPTSLAQCVTDPEATHWLLYTGGTTGVPKSVELPERAIAQMAMSVSVGWDLPANRNYLAVAPISHAAGMLITPTLLSGGTVTLMKAWDPQEWAATVDRERITLSFLVPTMIYSLLDSGTLDTADVSTLETIMYGASPMAPARLREGLERMGQVFCQLYGQTECAGIISSLWRHHHQLDKPERFASCGQPMPGVRVSLRDDDNQPVGVGERGEVCVQGLNVMKGYHKRPDLNAETLIDGWLHTGDVAVQDEEGFLYLVDRKKDMIVSGGFNVFPSEVEKILTEDPSVAAAAVIGVPHPVWGEAVKALVVPRPGYTVDEERLIELVKTRKGSHYAPKSLEAIEQSESPTRRVSGRSTGQIWTARFTESSRRDV